MRAGRVYRSSAGPEELHLVSLPVPSPGPGQVRVRVAATAVNPTDLAFRSGAHRSMPEGGLAALRARHGPWPGWSISRELDQEAGGGAAILLMAATLSCGSGRRGASGVRGGGRRRARPGARADQPAGGGHLADERPDRPGRPRRARPAAWPDPRGDRGGGRGRRVRDPAGTVRRAAGDRRRQPGGRGTGQRTGAHVVVPRGPGVAGRMRQILPACVDALVDMLAATVSPVLAAVRHVAGHRGATVSWAGPSADHRVPGAGLPAPARGRRADPAGGAAGEGVLSLRVADRFRPRGRPRRTAGSRRTACAGGARAGILIPVEYV